MFLRSTTVAITSVFSQKMNRLLKFINLIILGLLVISVGWKIVVRHQYGKAFHILWLDSLFMIVEI